MSDLLQTYISTHEMHGLGFREYRQVTTTFMKKHLKYKVDEGLNELNSVIDMQAEHTSTTTDMHYARATKDHRQVSRELMHLYYLISRQ